MKVSLLLVALCGSLLAVSSNATCQTSSFWSNPATRGSSGTFSFGPPAENYGNMERCTQQIAPFAQRSIPQGDQGTVAYCKLRFDIFDVETRFDTLSIKSRAGPECSRSPISSLFGMNSTCVSDIFSETLTGTLAEGTELIVPGVISNDFTVTLEFSSDASVTRPGVNGTFECDQAHIYDVIVSGQATASSPIEVTWKSKGFISGWPLKLELQKVSSNQGSTYESVGTTVVTNSSYGHAFLLDGLAYVFNRNYRVAVYAATFDSIPGTEFYRINQSSPFQYSGSVQCSGTSAVYQNNGSLSVGSASSYYNKNAGCVWEIYPSNFSFAQFRDIPYDNPYYVNVTLPRFDTEANYDSVLITRVVRPRPRQSGMRTPREVTVERLSGSLSERSILINSTSANDSFIRVEFTSDSNVQRSGFALQWETQRSFIESMRITNSYGSPFRGRMRSGDTLIFHWEPVGLWDRSVAIRLVHGYPECGGNSGWSNINLPFFGNLSIPSFGGLTDMLLNPRCASDVDIDLPGLDIELPGFGGSSSSTSGGGFSFSLPGIGSSSSSSSSLFPSISLGGFDFGFGGGDSRPGYYEHVVARIPAHRRSYRWTVPQSMNGFPSEGNVRVEMAPTEGANNNLVRTESGSPVSLQFSLDYSSDSATPSTSPHGWIIAVAVVGGIILLVLCVVVPLSIVAARRSATRRSQARRAPIAGQITDLQELRERSDSSTSGGSTPQQVPTIQPITRPSPASGVPPMIVAQPVTSQQGVYPVVYSMAPASVMYGQQQPYSVSGQAVLSPYHYPQQQSAHGQAGQQPPAVYPQYTYPPHATAPNAPGYGQVGQGVSAGPEQLYPVGYGAKH